MSVVLVTFPGAPKVSQEAIQEVSSAFTLLAGSLSVWSDTMDNGRVLLLLSSHCATHKS